MHAFASPSLGVKSYPRGVTTNSEGGIESYTAYYDVFEAMEKEGMVLNLHGEIPSDPGSVSALSHITPIPSNTHTHHHPHTRAYAF